MNCTVSVQRRLHQFLLACGCLARVTTVALGRVVIVGAVTIVRDVTERKLEQNNA